MQHEQTPEIEPLGDVILALLWGHHESILLWHEFCPSYTSLQHVR